MKLRVRKREERQTGPDKPNGRVALGLLLIGTGRRAGFAQFGGSNEAFLASLAPLLGFLIVLGGVFVWRGEPLRGLSTSLTALCALLMPAVVADLFCRLWRRRQHWALYANVLNCAQWLMLVVLALMLPLAGIVMALGLSDSQAQILLALAFTAYLLWFHWFAARHALDLSRGRALVVMLAVVFGTGLLLQLPLVLAGKPIDAPVLDMPKP